MSRAAAAESATTAQPAKTADSVKDRLQTIRGDIFSALEQYATDGEPFVAVDPATRLAWWGNGGWRNGGWRNGGWGDGRWGHGGWDTSAKRLPNWEGQTCTPPLLFPAVPQQCPDPPQPLRLPPPLLPCP